MQSKRRKDTHRCFIRENAKCRRSIKDMVPWVLFFKEAIHSGAHKHCSMYVKISRRNHGKLSSGYLWEDK